MGQNEIKEHVFSQNIKTHFLDFLLASLKDQDKKNLCYM